MENLKPKLNRSIQT